MSQNGEVKMEIKILFDNYTQDRSKFEMGWGFSCLINEDVLFDTGEDGDLLVKNVKAMGVDANKIQKIVISHDHYDHTGGLYGFLRQYPGKEVYILSSFREEIKIIIKKGGGKYIINDEFKELHPNIFTTGLIKGVYMGGTMPEQSLIVKMEKGLIVITGCSHPGIVTILERVKEFFPQEKIFAVLGGFHLLDKGKREIDYIIEKFKSLGVEKVGPTHCTGWEAIKAFQEAYGDNFLSLGAGATLTF